MPETILDTKDTVENKSRRHCLQGAYNFRLDRQKSK